MKTYPTFRIFIALTLMATLFSSCSKERFDVITKDNIVPIIDTETFVPVTETNKKPIVAVEPVKKTVSSSADFPFTTPRGTVVKANSYDFTFEDGRWVEYPIDIQIKELYSPMDMILNGKPTVSDGKILVTAGQVYVTATKDGKNLKLRETSQFSVSIPSNGNDREMKIFYGQEQSNGNVNWKLAQMQEEFLGQKDSLQSAIFFGQNNYEIFPSQIGWINCDKFYDYTGAKTRIKLTSTKPEIELISSFLYLDRIKSILQIWGGKSLDLPVGEHAKLICFAVTNENNLYSFIKEFNVEENQVIDIKLEKTTKEAFLEYLKNL